MRQERPPEPSASPKSPDPLDGQDAPAASDNALIPGYLLASLSPAGQRRLLAILQQNDVPGTTRFVAFRAEPFREKDLLDSFEALIKSPSRRTEARYVPHRADGERPQE